MKLYFSPGACSLSPHIVLLEAGLPFQLEQVDLHGTKKTKGGVDYATINPKGAVPALQLDDGQVLTEGAAIVQYLADHKPEAQLAPAAGTMERYRLQEWLNYIASELHKGFSPLFSRTNSDEVKQAAGAALAVRLDYVAGRLAGKQFLLGDRFSVADAYLFTVLSWSRLVGIDLAKWPTLRAYHEGLQARPAVKAALATEKAARS